MMVENVAVVVVVMWCDACAGSGKFSLAPIPIASRSYFTTLLSNQQQCILLLYESFMLATVSILSIHVLLYTCFRIKD